MELGIWAYGGAFLVSLALSLGLTPVVLRVANSRGIFDHPAPNKSHESPVPYLGGVAIVAAFSLAVGIAGVVQRPPSGLDELGVILGFAVALSVMGLFDDVRHLNPLPKFALEVAAGVALWAVGVQVAIFPSDVLNALFTVLWVVGITNAFNLLDNMDGLSAGIAAIASGVFFILAAINGQFLVAALSIALTGCALGFLRHNFHPARIYMGDTGSLFLGFVLAAIGIKLKFPGPNQITFMVPILVLGIPILDTTLVVVNRLLHRRNPLSGGRDHISHRLVFIGLPVGVAVGLIYGSSVILGWLGVVMSRIDRTSGFLLMALVVTVAAFVAVMLSLIPVYETSRRKRMMITEVHGHEEPEELPPEDEVPAPVQHATP